LLAAPFWANRNAHWRSPRGALQIFLILTALTLLWLSQQTMFWGVALISGLRALTSAGISPLSDSLALSITKKTQAGYGSIRVWGSVGWIVFVLLSGWLVDRYGLYISLIGAFAITAVAALVLFAIEPSNFYHRPSDDEAPPDFTTVVRRLLANRAMLGVAAMLIFINIGNSGITQFENVFLRDLGARDAIIGIAGMLSACVELPCMLWADRLCARRGSYNVLLTSMFLYVLLRVFVLIFPSVIAIMITRALAGFACALHLGTNHAARDSNRAGAVQHHAGQPGQYRHFAAVRCSL
jgi:PPP family 3-phenylpropionic acid transporter